MKSKRMPVLLSLIIAFSFLVSACGNQAAAPVKSDNTKAAVTSEEPKKEEPKKKRQSQAVTSPKVTANVVIDQKKWGANLAEWLAKQLNKRYVQYI